MKEVLIILGSKSDLPFTETIKEVLQEFEVEFELQVSSAHRKPESTKKLAKDAKKNGFKAIIAAAGMAAHLPGVVASFTTLPVIGVPLPGSALNGVDALYSIVQMPGGVPVASMAIGKAGMKNAALFAVQILAISNPDLSKKLQDYKDKMATA